MTPADRKAFVEIVVGFAELAGKQLSPAALELYWRAMQHWPLAEFRDAAAVLVTRCAFMPTPKDFEDLRKAGRMTAAEAWECARRACGSAIQHGRLTSRGTCGDELIDKAVRGIGGYGVIAMCESDKLHFLERRFCEHYATLRDVTDVREALPALTNPDGARTAINAPAKAAELLVKLPVTRGAV